MEQKKVLYLMQSFLHYILYGEDFIGYVKEPLHSIYLNLRHEKTWKCGGRKYGDICQNFWPLPSQN